MKIQNICCIGAGYVGGPTMAVIADHCPDIKVTVVDVNIDRINSWNSSHLPIYEPGLMEIINRVRGKNLFFSSDIDLAIAKSDCVFISVNTPTKTMGLGSGKASDLRYLEESARRIAANSTGHTIVVEKSTLPVKSAENIKSIFDTLGKGKSFDVLSNPEFLAEGTAIQDLNAPDRVLVGGESKEACGALVDVYKRWVSADKILTTNLWSAEMAKLASNAFLAQRVSSINSLSAFCEVTGANIHEVADAVGRDSRIGSKFLKAGPGFGGSCFKKDILNLVYLCEYHGLPEVAEYWMQVVKLNEWQKNRLSKVVIDSLFGNINKKRIAILGFAFKKNTNDIRESSAISIAKSLLYEGAILQVFDPEVNPDAIRSALASCNPDALGETIISPTVESAVEDADAAILLTDWDQIIESDWFKLGKIMRKPAWVFDTRAVLNRNLIETAGVRYWSLGTRK